MMTYDEQIAALGKNKKYVVKRLTTDIYPRRQLHLTAEEELQYYLWNAWTRAGSWEFHELLKARFNHNHWLAPWYQSYIGGVPDPEGIFTWQWVHGQWTYNFENMRTAEIAREWAEGALGLRPITNRMRFRGYDMSAKGDEWLDAVGGISRV